FEAADTEQALEVNDLESMAWAALWAGQVETCRKAWERAYAAHLEHDDVRRAASAALQVARRHGQRANPALARGWRATAARLLATQPDAPERGHLLNQEAYPLILAGDLEAAERKAQEAYEIGARAGARDVQITALHLRGQVLVRRGEVEQGLSLIDESVAQVAAGALDAYETGLVYCWTIGVCRDVADFERARELTEATAAWCEQHSVTAFPGVCRVHRAELFRLHGDLARADREAQAAADELMPRTLFWGARALYEIGMIKLREGDLAAADSAFDRAQELGMEPEPGRSLVLLARGRHEAARVGLDRALERHPQDKLERVALLAVLVDAAIASGQLEDAERAVKEIEETASGVRRAAFEATAAEARGAVQLARGDAGRAVPSLRSALQLWLSLGAAYETARTRRRLADAHAAEGDRSGARLELELAAQAFARIGARHEQANAERALRDAHGLDPYAPLTERQREVARLVAEGQTNKDIAATLVVSERTAEHHVQQILNRLDFRTRAEIAAWYASRR
ncbi:MAG: helix-turn-helix transcriptional regulator, partial [Solirubrobacteraceae bacterium]